MRIFSPVPKESKNQVNKAARNLRDNSGDLIWAQVLVDKWRAAHAYPINTFQSTIRRKLKKYSGEPIAAQRLKRMTTIIDKLRRESSMQLTNMQDIGGVRAIVKSNSDVQKLVKEYRNGSFEHELFNENDYVEKPKKDGYRSVHLIYKYKNKRNQKYDGLLLELQIRSRLQHIWATGVETMGLIRNEALKSNKGGKEWLDFFKLVSSAFASIEKTTLIPGLENLPQKEIFKKVSEIAKKINALDHMRGLPLAVKEISKGKEKSWYYHLIILNREKKTVEIRPYRRDDFKKASQDYAKVEAQKLKGEPIEPVLVSAGKIKELRQAYPNFFLDMREFSSELEKIIKES